MPEYLFVCGSPRSGTSQMTRLLTAHQDIAIGLERFNKVYLSSRPRRRRRLPRSQQDEVGPSLFAPERFWDLRQGDTHYQTLVEPFRSYYDRIRPKYAEARYVGDKYPKLFEHYQLIADRFPGARFVFLSRDLRSVAASYVVRAEDPADKWNESRRVAVAIEDWRASHMTTAEVQQRLPVFVARFESLAAGADLGPLLDFLDLEEDDGIRAAIDETRTTAIELDAERHGRSERFTDEERDLLDAAERFEPVAVVHETAAAQGRLW